MSDDLPPQDLALLQQFAQGLNNYINARAGIYREASDLSAIVNYSFSQNRDVAFDLAPMLTPEQLKGVLPQLFGFATYFNAYMQTATDLVFKLPIDWLRENIAKYAEPILQSQYIEAEEFDRIIYIYNLIDREMAFGVIKRALEHDDEDINKMGAIWQEKLNATE